MLKMTKTNLDLIDISDIDMQLIIFFIYFFFMRLLYDKHHLQCTRKTYLQYFEITLLTKRKSSLLWLTRYVTYRI